MEQNQVGHVPIVQASIVNHFSRTHDEKTTIVIIFKMLIIIFNLPDYTLISVRYTRLSVNKRSHKGEDILAYIYQNYI